LDFYLAEYYRSQGRRLDFAACLNGQAVFFLLSGPLGEAGSLLAHAEKIYRELDNQRGLTAAIGNRAIVALLEQKFREAFDLAHEQERLAKLLGDNTIILRSLATQASAKLGEGDTAEADRLLTEIERLSQETGDAEVLAHSWYERGLMLLENPNNIEKADELFKNAGRRYREIGHRGGLANSTACEASVLLLRGRFKEAWAKAKEANQLSDGVSDARLAALVAFIQSVVLDAAGRRKEANELKNKAERITRNFGAPLSVLNRLSSWPGQSK
jgi:tetratricopeptide (TPR) repeat protein